MNSHTTAPAAPQSVVARTTNDGARNSYALKASGLLLSGAALMFAALSGWQRGADTPSALAWAAVGIAAVLGAAACPTAMCTAAKGGEYHKAAMLAPAYALAVAMAVTVALGNAHGGRSLQAGTANKQADEIARARGDHDRALSELTGLAPARPTAELESLIAPLSAKIGSADCGSWVPSKSVRAACADRSPLTAELGRAQRRNELEASIKAAGAQLAQLKPAPEANADAAAIAAYLAALGFNVAPATVVLWLQLIAVGLVELAPGLLLAAAESGTPTPSAPRGNSEPEPKRQPIDPPTESTAANGYDRRSAVIERLRTGALEGRQTDLARALAIPTTSLRRIVESEPSLRMRALPGGVTRLELLTN